MTTLNITLGTNGIPMTVSEMRRRLAQVVSRLNGDQEVTFSFHARLEHYPPATLAVGARQTPVIYGPLARPDNG